MRRYLAGLVLAAAALTACGGSGGSGSGDGDKAACEALSAAKGKNAGIYADLYKKDLSGELRTALKELEKASTGGEIQPDTFVKAGKVAALCAAKGVVLSG